MPRSRAKRSVTTLRLVGSLCVSILMAITGQTRSHWVQPMQTSWWKMWRPRKRNPTAGASSGYCTVCLRSKTWRMLTAALRTTPKPGTPRLVFNPISFPDPSWLEQTVGRHHLDSADGQVEEGQRRQHFPAKAQELVDAEPRHREPHQREDAEHEVALGQEPEEREPEDWDVLEAGDQGQPTAEEEGGEDGAEGEGGPQLAHEKQP